MPIKGVSTLHSDYSIVSLSWNHQGNELAVFDSIGRVSILTQLFTLSDFSIPRKCVVDMEDQLGVVVGLIWLNGDKTVMPLLPLLDKRMLTRPLAHVPGVCAQRGGSMEDYLEPADTVGSLQSCYRNVGAGHGRQKRYDSTASTEERPYMARRKNTARHDLNHRGAAYSCNHGCE